MKTIYIGGQDAVDAAHNIIGKGDIQAQAEQVMRNLQTTLPASGARLEHVIKWHVYIVQGQPLQDAFGVFKRAWGARPNPPAIIMIFVAGLAHPDFLLEVDAVAVVPNE